MEQEEFGDTYTTTASTNWLAVFLWILGEVDWAVSSPEHPEPNTRAVALSFEDPAGGDMAR